MKIFKRIPNQVKNDKNLRNFYSGKLPLHFLENNSNLSWKGKGLYTYMWTRPDDWVLNTTDIVNRSKDGIRSVKSNVKELKDEKYLYLFPMYKNKKIFMWIYDLYHEPVDLSFEQKRERQNDLQTQIESIENMQENSQHVHCVLVRNVSNYTNKFNNSSLNTSNSKELAFSKENDVFSHENTVAPTSLNTTKNNTPCFKSTELLPTPPAPTVPTDLITQFVEVWNKYGTREHRRNTAIMMRARKYIKELIEGTFFDFKEFKNWENTKITLELWEYALKNFYKSRDAGYQPKNKKFLEKINLDTFIYCQYTNERMMRSPLIHFIEHIPTAIGIIQDDPNVPITNYLQKRYCKEVLGDIDIQLPISELNKFVEGSRRFTEYLIQNTKRLDKNLLHNDQVKGELFWKSVTKDLNDLSKLTPGWFCSDLTFTRRIPAYLFGTRQLHEQ
jgi:hypothetical protein